MPVKIEMTEEQARVVEQALDLYSRLGSGQWEVLVEFLHRHFQFNGHTTADVRDYAHRIKRLLWDLPSNGNLGIMNRETPSECRESYDILQVIRKGLHDHRMRSVRTSEAAKRRMRSQVSSNPYMPANPDWPPVKIIVTDDDLLAPPSH